MCRNCFREQSQLASFIYLRLFNKEMRDQRNSLFVRPATGADVAQLCGLLSLLFAQEADFVPNVPRQERALHLILGQPEFGRIYCATEGESIVGMVSILFTASTAEGRLAAWLEDMIVHPDYRNHGVGRRLLQEAVSQAQAAGCGKITLLTDATNSSAMRFYGQAGFVRSRLIPLRICSLTRQWE